MRALQLHAVADEIELSAAYDTVGAVATAALFKPCAPIDATREDVAVLLVSQSLTNVGVIEGANSVALTLFGYTRRDLLGQNVAAIIPFPLSTAHDSYLMRYVTTGRPVRFS